MEAIEATPIDTSKSEATSYWEDGLLSHREMVSKLMMEIIEQDKPECHQEVVDIYTKWIGNELTPDEVNTLLEAIWRNNK